MRSVRFRIVITLLIVALAGVSITAWASHSTSVRTYTGCLTTATGAISNVKPGQQPLSGVTCPSGQTLIHLSGGDITSILPAVDGGLTGGATNGDARLGIDFANLDGRYINEADAGTPINWRGAWSASVSYESGDAIHFNGSSYVAKTANSDTPPPSVQTWETLAKVGAKGAKGDVGLAGDTGPQGAAGPQGAIGPQGPGLQSYAGTVRNDCVEADDSPLSSASLENGFCRITLPGGVINSFPLTFISLGNIVGFETFGDGSGYLDVQPTNSYFYVLVTTHGPTTPGSPQVAPGSSDEPRTSE